MVSTRVTSLANSTVKLLAGLRLRKFRAETGLFLAEGARTALDALGGGVVPKILAYAPEMLSPNDAKVLREACLRAGGQCVEVTEKILAKITRKDNPQPVAAAYPIELRALGKLRPSGDSIYVALDRVRDPGNLGTIIRTADAIAAGGVVLIGDSCDPYAPESVRASMGSIFNVPIHACDEAEFVAHARHWPGTVVAASAAAPVHYRRAKYKGAVMAVLGTEQSGLSPAVAAACTLSVKIPIFGKPESLNLAIAAGILLYGIRESRAAG